MPAPTTCWVIETRSRLPWVQIEPRIAEHRAYQDLLVAQGVLVASGPYLDGEATPTGDGLSLLLADDRAAAEVIAQGDPLVRDGLREATVCRWQMTRWRTAESDGRP